MIASVYIKNGNIHFYNENRRFTDIGGIAYELGRPLLDFICYEHDRFDEAFTLYAEAFENEFAYTAVREPEFISSVKESARNMQQREVYIYFYHQMLMEFIYDFVDSPRTAIERLEKLLSGAYDRLSWTVDFEWPVPVSPFVQVALYADKEKRLFRAAMDVVALMSEDLKAAQSAVIYEIELLLALREQIDIPINSPMEYLYQLEANNKIRSGHYFFLDNPFSVFYGVTKPPEIAELYEINMIKDLIRFEFMKMIEHDIFIKKCKNCERYFIPRGRADAEYCSRIFGESGRKCSEIGATLRYERKVTGNPILEAHKKAYRRFNSRTRAKKMTQSEFMAWSDEASRKRDECLAGELPFEEFTAWLEQGRIRKGRNKYDYRQREEDN